MAEQVEAALTELARKKLLGYAFKLISNKPWPGERDLRELAEDIVSEAICKAMTGERRWNPEITPNPFDFLLSAVKSLVDAHSDNDRNAMWLDPLNTPKAVSLSALIGQPHNASEANDFFCGLMLELGDDELCVEMLDLYEKGYRPEDMADELGVAIDKIYAANKRLKRKAKAYLERLKEGT